MSKPHPWLCVSETHGPYTFELSADEVDGMEYRVSMYAEDDPGHEHDPTHEVKLSREDCLAALEIARVSHPVFDWRSLTGEQRLALIATTCRSCGDLDPRCRCGDDS